MSVSSVWFSAYASGGSTRASALPHEAVQENLGAGESNPRDTDAI